MNTRDHEPLTPEERNLAQRLSRLGGHAAPSAALDAKILAAARDATTTPAMHAHARRRPHWPFGVGIAASLAVAMGIAWQLRPQPENEVLQVSGGDAARHDAMVVEAPKPMPRVAAQVPAAADDAVESAPATVARRETPAAAEPLRALRAPPPAPEPVLAVEAPPPAEAPVVFDEVALKRTAAAGQENERRQRSEAVLDAMAPAASAPAPPAPPPPPRSPAMAPTQEQRGFVASPPPAHAGAVAPATAIGTTTQVARDRKAAAQSAAAAASAGPTLDRIEVTGSRIDREAEDAIPADQPLDDQPPASADSPQVRDAWLKRIRELRAAGDLDDARASLREFMRRHPGTAVPDDLRPLLGE